MFRRHLLAKKVGKNVHFRWRGGDVSRLEGFSDAVFGFALTLLVVSLEVPQTFDELLSTLPYFGGFAFCFFLLTELWYRHYLFFRRYGLQDTFTIVLNAVLLFVVLFYIYPLKFIMTVGVTAVLHHNVKAHLASGAEPPMIRYTQLPLLVTIYGMGLAAVCLIFALLYWHAYRKRAVLKLNSIEEHDTLVSIQTYMIGAACGVLPYLVTVLIVRRRLILALAVSLAATAAVLLSYGWMSRRRRKIIDLHETFEMAAAPARAPGAEESKSPVGE